MTGFYKWAARIYLLVMMFLTLICYLTSQYSIFFVSGTDHGLVNNGTLVVFEKTEPENVEAENIIITKHREIARVKRINRENNTYSIVTDEFGKEKEIRYEEIEGVLKFHISEIGILYHEYLSRYQTLLMTIPFFLLAASFFVFAASHAVINKENLEFDFYNIVSAYKQNRKYRYSHTVKGEISEIKETIHYDNRVKNGKVPEFLLNNLMKKRNAL